jgi:ParB-like chromosome segregation protein Spo0J
MQGKNSVKVEKVAIDDLQTDPANLRAHDERNARGIESSLRRFGAGRSIVIDGHGVVVAGNGTIEAARRAGMAEVLIVDPGPGQVVAVRRKDWTTTEATAYSIADNRLTDLSAFKEDDLADTLRSLELDGFDLDDVGFSSEELRVMLGDGPEPASTDATAPDEFKSYDESIPTDHTCPKCGYAWSGGEA